MFYPVLIILFGISVAVHSQSINLPESIVVSLSPQNELVSHYTVQPKNTLYSICRFYQCDLQELRRENPGVDLAVIEPGVSLRIPFKQSLLRYKGDKTLHKDDIAIYYKTSPKDNLFRISRVYFDQRIETIMQLNKLKDHNLQPGQMVLVGWASANSSIVQRENPTLLVEEEQKMKTDSESDSSRAVFVKKLDSKHIFSGVKNNTVVEMKTKRVVQQNGLAIWNKESKASGIFALHNDAKPGTLLEVINPLLNRKSYIKVIGKIPGNTYADNVKVILSPEAARSLGALDPRFYVRMNYISE